MFVFLCGFCLPIATAELGDPDGTLEEFMDVFEAFDEGIWIGTAVGVDADEVHAELVFFDPVHEGEHPFFIRMNATGAAEADMQIPMQIPAEYAEKVLAMRVRGGRMSAQSNNNE